ncbi:MAG: hypothetical protein HZB99_00670 [Candidatus Harrisonbacteria bacterium]|nr:hypothetical protein [Candidatus Harrisonbacteria bacterium]
MFLQEVMTHFFIGVTLAVLTVTVCYYYGKRRTLLRFGPLILGTKMHWIGYYLVALVFEVATSFHWGVGARLYAELALSPFQAVGLTLGLFLVDRLAMMLVEPQSDWRPESSGTPPALPENVPPVVSQQPPAPVEQETPPVDDSTWLKNIVKGLADGVGSLVNGVRQGLENRRKEADAKSQADKTERLRRLDDHLRGH